MAASISTTDIKEDLIKLFKDQSSLLVSESGSAVNKVRDKALHDFEILGIPTIKNEAYK